MSHIRLFIALLLALTLAACAAVPGQRDVITLSIIGTNDVHGAIAANEDAGGLVAVSAYADALRRARGRVHRRIERGRGRKNDCECEKEVPHGKEAGHGLAETALTKLGYPLPRRQIDPR